MKTAHEAWLEGRLLVVTGERNAAQHEHMTLAVENEALRTKVERLKFLLENTEEMSNIRMRRLMLVHGLLGNFDLLAQEALIRLANSSNVDDREWATPKLIALTKHTTEDA